jgi:integrase
MTCAEAPRARLASNRHNPNCHSGLRRGQRQVVGASLISRQSGRAYARLARKAKISSTRLRDTRHKFAATLLTEGTDVRTTAGLMGHSSATMTLISLRTQRDAVDRLGATLDAISERLRRRNFRIRICHYGNRMATAGQLGHEKARNHGPELVALTGVESDPETEPELP